ncbi:hypothetical protein LZ30DRAFT_352977 [Colletotrichum cereale]|nr:hypothetical protein LZ30DRAFT_352977 [Colletotrichum cereale]
MPGLKSLENGILASTFQPLHNPHRDFFLTARDHAPARNEKNVTPVRRPSTPTPTARPKARPRPGTRSSPPSIQHRDRALVPPSRRKVRGQPEFFTLGCRGYHSSTRVGSVAPLGNQERVEYYRNDSPVEGVSQNRFGLFVRLSARPREAQAQSEDIG